MTELAALRGMQQRMQLLVFDAQDTASHSDSKQSQQSQTPTQKAPGRKQRVRRRGKPSYCVRKEEKLALQLQAQLLQAQMATLTTSMGSTPSSLVFQQQCLARQLADNDMLRGVIREQQLALAGVQATLGAQMTRSQQSPLPFESCIRLGTDWPQRHATLLALKNAKLRGAQQYMAQRTQLLDPCTPYSEHSRFVNADGDLCALRLDILPFESVRSVKQVFDALLFYLFNMEISVTEVLGDVTVREGEGVRMQGVSQNRLISNVLGDVQVEINSVTFCNLYGGSEANSGDTHNSASEREVGVIVANFVTEDALYPYSPATRLRNDITAAMTVTLEPRKKAVVSTSSNALTAHSNQAEYESDGSELVVVLKRTAFMNLRRTDLPIPAHVLHELREHIDGWCDAMTKTARDILYPQRAPASSSSFEITASQQPVLERTG